MIEKQRTKKSQHDTKKLFENHHTEIIEEFQLLIAAFGTEAVLIQSIRIRTKVNTIWQANPNYTE